MNDIETKKKEKLINSDNNIINYLLQFSKEKINDNPYMLKQVEFFDKKDKNLYNVMLIITTDMDENHNGKNNFIFIKYKIKYILKLVDKNIKQFKNIDDVENQTITKIRDCSGLISKILLNILTVDKVKNLSTVELINEVSELLSNDKIISFSIEKKSVNITEDSEKYMINQNDCLDFLGDLIID